jgi:membrane protein DedA with SNARE-associated domain
MSKPFPATNLPSPAPDAIMGRYDCQTGSQNLEALEHQLVAFLTNLFQTIGWLGVVVIMTLESANIPIPSEVTMPLAGWMLIQARGLSAWHALWQGGLWGAVGCTLGSAISYALGAWGGRPLVERYGRYILIAEEDLEKADRWFARWGDWAAFISRLLPIVRTFISFPAGVARMNFPRFVSYSFAGSFIWCALLALGGYFFGEHWEELRAMMRPFDIPIALVIVAGLVYYVYHHVRKGSRKARVADVED